MMMIKHDVYLLRQWVWKVIPAVPTVITEFLSAVK